MNKWKDKKTNCSIVHVKSRNKNKKNEEAEVWLVTRGGEKTRENFNHDEGSGQNPNKK
jgi:hypothetical protein